MWFKRIFYKILKINSAYMTIFFQLIPITVMKNSIPDLIKFNQFNQELRTAEILILNDVKTGL